LRCHRNMERKAVMVRQQRNGTLAMLPGAATGRQLVPKVAITEVATKS
jgi:hypothetical protein